MEWNKIKTTQTKQYAHEKKQIFLRQWALFSLNELKKSKMEAQHLDKFKKIVNGSKISISIYNKNTK